MDPERVLEAIEDRIKKPGSDYICVADGVIVSTANRNPEYLRAVNGGMFAICDSSYVPLYIKWIYGKKCPQYCGSDIFVDVVTKRKYRMIFLGTRESVLRPLQKNLAKMNPDVIDMKFVELPFCKVDEFDYPAIARMIEDDGADIIWLALGAPKQEYFMANLKPHLKHGVVVAVGAAFKFFSGVDSNRAPKWMIRNHLEFVHRIYKEPKKQLRRCYDIARNLPSLLYSEWQTKRRNEKQPPKPQHSPQSPPSSPTPTNP